jgi:broad specificity phosphatase PhoE
MNRKRATQNQNLFAVVSPGTYDNQSSENGIESAARPLANRLKLDICVVDDLRERMPTNNSGRPFGPDWYQAWCRAWDDFTFAPPGGESSLAAQARIVHAIGSIARTGKGTAVVFTHGHVLALFLNAATGAFGRQDAERLTNPDVIRIELKNGLLTWDGEFRLAGLKEITTSHEETPLKEAAPP